MNYSKNTSQPEMMTSLYLIHKIYDKKEYMCRNGTIQEIGNSNETIHSYENMVMFCVPFNPVYYKTRWYVKYIVVAGIIFIGCL